MIVSNEANSPDIALALTKLPSAKIKTFDVSIAPISKIIGSFPNNVKTIDKTLTAAQPKRRYDALNNKAFSIFKYEQSDRI